MNRSFKKAKGGKAQLFAGGMKENVVSELVPNDSNPSRKIYKSTDSLKSLIVREISGGVDERIEIEWMHSGLRKGSFKVQMGISKILSKLDLKKVLFVKVGGTPYSISFPVENEALIELNKVTKEYDKYKKLANKKTGEDESTIKKRETEIERLKKRRAKDKTNFQMSIRRVEQEKVFQEVQSKEERVHLLNKLERRTKKMKRQHQKSEERIDTLEETIAQHQKSEERFDTLEETIAQQQKEISDLKKMILEMSAQPSVHEDEEVKQDEKKGEEGKPKDEEGN